MVRKTVNILLGFIGLGFTFYMLYQTLTVHEGLLPMVLRIIASFIWLTLGIFCIKERNLTPDDQTKIWFYKKRTFGKVYYIFKYAIFWTVFVGFISWMASADFHDAHLKKDAFIHTVIFLLFGVFIGYQEWNRNEKEATKLGLYENENSENLIQQKKV